MDFTRQGTGAQPGARPNVQQSAASSGDSSLKHKGNKSGLGKWMRIGYATLLFGTTILVVAIAGLTAFGGNDESKYVNTSKYQAVFLNGGSTNGQSVYFGHITKLTSGYLVLQDIYYITTPSGSSSTSTSNSNNYQLTKLGCQQLHDPYDQMVINQAQIAFWENLNNSGKVVQTILTFQKDNPNGPNCSQTTSSSTSTGTTQSTTSTTTPTTSTTTPSTPATSSTTK
jgi:hypothetical protein